ncbi:MAG: hypothetical protein AAF901_01080 [Bacteroidota bacterium]
MSEYTLSIILALLVVVISYDNLLVSAIGLGWSTFLVIIYFERLGKALPILELMLVMAALQWIVGAKIAYWQESDHFKYYMYVDENAYMSLVVPGVICFSLGVLFFKRRVSFIEVNQRLERYVLSYPRSPYILIVIGLFATYTSGSIPLAFRFIFYLLQSFQFAGVALLIFLPDKAAKWYWFLVVMGLLVVSSVVRGLFHDLILWSILLYSFICLKFRISFLVKLVTIAVAVISVSVLQEIKSEYRQLIYGKSNQERVGIFYDLITQRVAEPAVLDDNTEGEELEALNVRLNQGWIISAILYNMPRYQNFIGGESITEAIGASLLPRFIYQDKKQAGGRENFRVFTGLPIRDDTSMGVSILGEAYANYGMSGAYLFMFIWGAFLALGFSFLLKRALNYPLLVAMLPLIFLQVIKAETELVVVLNHFVKSTVLVLSFLWAAQNLLGWKFQSN